MARYVLDGTGGPISTAQGLSSKVGAIMTKTIKQWTADQWDALKFDGCTGIPNFHLETPCDRHDRHYATHQHRDGRPITRFEADVELAKDAWKAMPVFPEGEWTLRNFLPRLAMAPVRVVVKVVVPPVVFAAVRVGGEVHWYNE